VTTAGVSHDLLQPSWMDRSGEAARLAQRSALFRAADDRGLHACDGAGTGEMSPLVILEYGLSLACFRAWTRTRFRESCSTR
jgi:hypothetical protein